MTATSVSDAELLRFATDPIGWFGPDRTAMHTLPKAELEALQLAAGQLRFRDLAPRLPVVAGMAEEQGITGVERLEDLAPLLFPHTVYKSYPSSLLVDGRWDLLTKWLSRLVTADLGVLDLGKADSIDAWLELIDDSTELRLAHSSGTTGTLSFIPHTRIQYERLYQVARLDVLPDGDPAGVDVVWPSFRTGRSGIARHATAMWEQLAGSEDRFHPLHDGHLSADVMFLAGRLRAADRRSVV